MNRIYKLIWNIKTGTFIAVAENARSAGKKSSLRNPMSTRHFGFALKTLAVSLLMASGSSMLYAQPVGGVVSAGSAQIDGTLTNTTINQSSQNVAINWQSFNINRGESVNFVQPNSSAVALNRVLGSDGSSIMGNLSANGKVFLINPNGVLFGPTASVNVGSLVASTLNITDADFMANEYHLSGATTGTVLNQGAITTTEGGFVALLGANVSNQGVIAAKLGSVVLAAGRAMTLDVAGDKLLNIVIDQGMVNALVENGGLIQADGGHVLMTTQSAGNLLTNAVNNTGVVRAQTIQNIDGTIKLLGDVQNGSVNVTGILDASAPNGGNGGFIETSAAHVNISNDAKITTAAPSGLTGNWLIDPQDFTISGAGDISGPTLSAQLVNSSITILSTQGAVAGNGDIFVNDPIT
ncbi:MAG: filamentous hemagglutinin N-terminal domain-containing protein, partial [Agitococcus sp.]|nr:filamentous hemagglutinin N-terminal domain-containing protein [Agitococcus sp.]